MMDDIAEQQDVAKEISEAISNPVAFGGVSNKLLKFLKLGVDDGPHSKGGYKDGGGVSSPPPPEILRQKMFLFC